VDPAPPAVSRIRTAAPADGAALDALHRSSSYFWEEDRANLDAHPEVLGVPRARLAAGAVRVAEDDAGPRTFGFYESVGFIVGESVSTQFTIAARLRRELR
jgi:hypothetical protein